MAKRQVSQGAMRIEACRHGETRELEYLVYSDDMDKSPNWLRLTQLENANAALYDFMMRNEKSIRARKTCLPQCSAKPKDKGHGKNLKTSTVTTNKVKASTQHKKGAGMGRKLVNNPISRRKTNCKRTVLRPIMRKKKPTHTDNSNIERRGVCEKAYDKKKTPASKRAPEPNLLVEQAIIKKNMSTKCLGARMITNDKTVFKSQKAVVGNEKLVPLRRRTPNYMLNDNSHRQPLKDSVSTCSSPKKARVFCTVPLTSTSLSLCHIILSPDILATTGTEKVTSVKGALEPRKTSQVIDRAKKHQLCRLANIKSSTGNKMVLLQSQKSKLHGVKGNRSIMNPAKRLRMAREADVETDSNDSGEIFFKLKDPPENNNTKLTVIPPPANTVQPVHCYSETMAYKTPPSSPHSNSPNENLYGHCAPQQAHIPEFCAAQLPKQSMFPVVELDKETMLLTAQQRAGCMQRSGKSLPLDRRVSVRTSESAFKYKEIVVRKCPGYTHIMLEAGIKTRQGLNPQAFTELNQVLHNAKFDDSRLILVSGSGNTFCSGVDLRCLQASDRRKAAITLADSLRDFISNLIVYPKPIVAAVNGAAVGLGMSLLSLCDIVYASDKATFYCPYAKLGQTPEGCASFTFPQSMGIAMANEILMAGRRITAIEAYNVGFVSQVFWPTTLMEEVIPRVQSMAQQSSQGLEATKLMMCSHVRNRLEITNENECHMLKDLWSSDECACLINNYLQQQRA